MMQESRVHSSKENISPVRPPLVGEGQHPDKMQGHGYWRVLASACCDQAELNSHGRCSMRWPSVHRIALLSSRQDLASRLQWF